MRKKRQKTIDVLIPSIPRPIKCEYCDEPSAGAMTLSKDPTRPQQVVIRACLKHKQKALDDITERIQAHEQVQKINYTKDAMK